MVYGRRHGSRELNFEASGGLLEASLVMRDRETDSWWSIMTSTAIGGQLEGADLEELPLGEKTTWGDWKQRYPHTRILSVDGQEHDLNNPYDNYFGSEGTFRDLQVSDQRLAAKAPIFSFWHDGRPFAVPHEAFAGGAIFTLADGTRIFLRRDAKASVFASTDAYRLDETVDVTPRRLWKRIKKGDPTGVEVLPGFDTYWYTWVSANEGSELIR